MKPEVAAKVVTALRSGQYQQTTGLLRAKGCFCIGGVICDLYREETGALRWDEFDGCAIRNGNGRWVGAFKEILPGHVKTWAGISSAEETHLMGANDGWHGQPAHTFADFAANLASDPQWYDPEAGNNKQLKTEKSTHVSPD